MKRAAVSLRRTHENISAIAFAAGFGDLSTFNRRFQRIFGLSPSAFRSAVVKRLGFAHQTTPRSRQIVVDHLAEAERQVGDDVRRRDDFEHRQLGDRRQRVRMKLKRAGPGPGALQVDILKVVLDQLADARRAVDMRNDFQEIVRRLERGL